jgi:hypothetical protein
MKGILAFCIALSPGGRMLALYALFLKEKEKMLLFLK